MDPAAGYIIDQLIYIPGYILYFIGVPKTFNFSTNVNGEVNGTSGSSGGNTLILLLSVGPEASDVERQGHEDRGRHRPPVT